MYIKKLFKRYSNILLFMIFVKNLFCILKSYLEENCINKDINENKKEIIEKKKEKN